MPIHYTIVAADDLPTIGEFAVPEGWVRGKFEPGRGRDQWVHTDNWPRLRR